MPTTIWEVQISGRASDLDHLCRHFTAPPVVVTKDDRDSCYLLQSASFRSLSEPNAVRDAATSLLAVLSGALTFVRGSDEPLQSGAVYLRHTDGHRDIFVLLEGITIRTEVGDIGASITNCDGAVREVTPPPRPTVSLTRAALSDAAISKALRLLGSDANTWVGLYRLHEVVEADVGGEHQMVKRGWGSSRQLKRFKHSANSVAVAGDNARHGKELSLPPGAPMSLSEAKAYVLYVLQAWLSAKNAV
jgi:hypothetical protein